MGVKEDLAKAEEKIKELTEANASKDEELTQAKERIQELVKALDSADEEIEAKDEIIEQLQAESNVEVVPAGSVDFPKMMYKEGGEVKLQAGKFSTKIVNNEAQQAAAEKNGWTAEPKAGK